MTFSPAVWLTVSGETKKYSARTTIASGVGTITFPGEPFIALAHLRPSGAIEHLPELRRR